MTQHLILHKVRGEPAFDIAEKLMIGDEEGWIIPTSGHRAYPCRHWPLDDLSDVSDITRAGYHDHPYEYIDEPIPADWPDHYPVQGQPPKANFNIMKVISGLLPKMKDRRF